jgi:hypothetical protein
VFERRENTSSDPSHLLEAHLSYLLVIVCIEHWELDYFILAFGFPLQIARCMQAHPGHCVLYVGESDFKKQNFPN